MGNQVIAVDTSDLVAVRSWLDNILLAQDPTDGLWAACNSGQMNEVLPELMALEMEQHSVHKHKDVLAHTIQVTSQARPDLLLRFACLMHDIGKPATRKFSDAGVTFRHHEVVGSRIAEQRLTELGYDEAFVDDVTELVRLSGRFKGYSDGWSDSAVRRYAREAGGLLGFLNDLVRADCTTKNPRKFENLQLAVSDLESRISELQRQDIEASIRPPVSGADVMSLLGIGEGPQVGQIMKMVNQLHKENPDESKEFFEKAVLAYEA